MTCGDRTISAVEGATFVVPKKTLHALRNALTTTSRVLVIMIAAGFERFFEEVDGVTDPGQLIQIAKRYDVRFLSRSE